MISQAIILVINSIPTTAAATEGLDFSIANNSQYIAIF